MSSLNKNAKVALVALRVVIGWLFFYAGITKVINPEWTSAGYLNNAKAFTGLFHWFASSGMIGIVDFLNEWGLTLLGISLIFGIFVRWSSILGIVLMMLYYLPLGFPYPNTHSLIVDEHVIYALILLLFIYTKAGNLWGFDRIRKQG